MCEDTCDTAALVITELVTNAIVHTASSRVVCELHDHDDTVRIAVRDEGCAPGEPQPSPQRPDEEHGRGLLLVDALCAAWGAQEHGPGLLVWAELPHKADAPHEDDDTARNDLGWGARPKPLPSGGPGDDDEAEALVRPRTDGGPRGQARSATGASVDLSRGPGSRPSIGAPRVPGGSGGPGGSDGPGGSGGPGGALPGARAELEASYAPRRGAAAARAGRTPGTGAAWA